MSTLSPLRVLVVDDDVDTAQSLCGLLETMGCTAIACNDGPEGLSVADRFDPHLAILDLLMPRMRGCQLVRHLRFREANSLALVVCISGCTSLGDQQISVGAGFDAYLVKPIRTDTLAQLVEQAQGLTTNLRWSGPKRLTTPQELTSLPPPN